MQIKKQGLKPQPASTAVLVRQAARDIEVLLLLRNRHLVFNGGQWVFPGGRIDPLDYPDADCKQEYQAALNAAVRETEEEAGITIELEALRHIAHWTTPEGYSRRFSTWFFLATLTRSVTIKVDHQEIIDFCWRSPCNALLASERGELQLPEPTLQTLRSIAPYRSTSSLHEALAQRPVHVFPKDSQDYPRHCIPR